MYKKKSWLRLCTLHQINKWDLLSYVKEPVYRSKYLIQPGLELQTRACLKCDTPLNLGIYKGTFIAGTTCGCAKDDTNLMTLDKLLTTFSEEQATIIVTSVNNRRKKGLPNTINFWLDKGFTAEQACDKVSEIQKTRSTKSPATKKGVRGYSQRTVEYWLKQGYAIDQARQKVREVQTTNGLTYYTKKYGNQGVELFNSRINQWLNADGNKKMIQNRSKISLELFEQLGVGDYGINEKTVRGQQKVHRVDYVHSKKIIEFYGDYWHGNPAVYPDNAMIRKKKIIDVWMHDERKIKDLEANGYTVLVIWESEFKKYPVEVLQKCKDFIE
jgi:G:T-mismatch repair DNA endonuclease (very short patch repair protein)